MPAAEPTHHDVYRAILDYLRKHEAGELADEIERTVARGVVLTEQKTEMYSKSSVFRPMEEAEALSVALEFLLAVLSVPQMLDAVATELGTHEIQWKPEREGTELERVTPIAPNLFGQTQLPKYLAQIRDFAVELKLALPEIA